MWLFSANFNMLIVVAVENAQYYNYTAHAMHRNLPKAK